MPYLIAQGSQPQHRWRRLVPERTVINIGRSTSRWKVPWDSQISRNHITLQLDGEVARVQRYSEASNPVFYQGQEADEFTLDLNQHFVIGETSFTLAPSHLAATIAPAPPAAEQTFLFSDLHNMPFEQTAQRIELLSTLPQIISSATDDDELLSNLCDWLFQGIQRASGIAIVRQTTQDLDSIEVMHWDYRGKRDTYFSPSQNLIDKAIGSQLSTIHFWNQDTQSEYTELQGIDWAFCIPVQGTACHGWGLYIAGQTEGQSKLGNSSLTQLQVKQDMKYAELAATTLSQLRTLKNLERSQAHFRQYFPDVVVDSLMSGASEQILSPREVDLSVMFCDLTGFTHVSEGSAEDLMKLLSMTSESLSLITQQILAHDGVIGDFHGDAAMGFWGWPFPYTPKEHAIQACTAARDILSDLVKHEAFSATLGIASGRSVAGEIGSNDQVKVSVLGPVVNLAARLESMNRQFGTSILIDASTAKHIETEFQKMKVVPIGLVRPFGMERAVEVSTLLPKADAATIQTQLEQYADALTAVEESRLEEACELLSEVTDGKHPQLAFAHVLLGHVELHLALPRKTKMGLLKSEPHIMHLATK